MVTTRPPKTIVKPTALGPVANTDTKLLIYGLFQKGRVLAQDGGEDFTEAVRMRWFRTRRDDPEVSATPPQRSPDTLRANSASLRNRKSQPAPAQCFRQTAAWPSTTGTPKRAKIASTSSRWSSHPIPGRVWQDQDSRQAGTSLQ